MNLIKPFIILIFISLYSCTVITKKNINSEVIPKVEKYSKYGNPKSYKVFGKRYYTKKTHIGYSKKGIASWYGKKFHGRLTSSRETYDMNKLTAAHKSLPIPCYARVTNLSNNKSVVVRINDRGPFIKGRIIDLSHAAAKKLGIVLKGTARVHVETIDARNN